MGKATKNPYPKLATIDYIRLATFDFQTYIKVSAAMKRKYVGWRKGRWLQYKMERSQDLVSFGIGEQSKRPHGIFEASGVDAHIFYHWLMQAQAEHLDNIYATRIDFQVTKETHEDLDWITCYKRIRKPKQIILGDDGSTIYIGNRESDSFWRIYEKTAELTRVEVELKGKQAKRAWKTLLAGSSASELFNYYLTRSRVPAFLVEYYLDNSSVTDLEDLVEVVPQDLEKTFQWLATLDSLIYKMANDHDYAVRTAELINRWHEYTEDLA